MGTEPFNRLVKLVARAFYDDTTANLGNHPKTSGIAVVVLDALTRRQWVREEDLAKDLKLNTQQLRRTLRFLEEEKLIARDHRKETAKRGEEKTKMHTQSYCCIDYAQIYDVVRYRLHRMKKKLNDKFDNENIVQEYVCQNCLKRYTALDALRLISMEDEYFHCESCNGELVAESDKLACQEIGYGDDNARRRRREKLKDMLQKMEVQLKPLMDQLTKVKDFPVPEYGTLQAWKLLNLGEFGSCDPSKSSQRLGFEETKVEVVFSGVDEGEEITLAKSVTDTKVLPPWMIKKGMNITAEQRGEVKLERTMDANTSAPADFADGKKSKAGKDDTTSLYNDYYHAGYANLENCTFERQVGTKSKREDMEGADDSELEEDMKVNALNFQVDDASGDDDIEWEEG